jgi:hypothetical protein
MPVACKEQSADNERLFAEPIDEGAGDRSKTAFAQSRRRTKTVHYRPCSTDRLSLGSVGGTLSIRLIDYCRRCLGHVLGCQPPAH